MCFVVLLNRYLNRVEFCLRVFLSSLSYVLSKFLRFSRITTVDDVVETTVRIKNDEGKR